MEFSYETQGTNTYFTYKLKPEDELDTVSLNMMKNNHISGLAPIIYTQMDEERYLKYNISSKVAVKEFLHGFVTKKSLVDVFIGIVDAAIDMEEYMMDTSSFVLDVNDIFIDVSTHDVAIINLPIGNIRNTENDLGLFFKNIVFGTQFDQSENGDYIGKIINYLNTNSAFSPAGFKILLESFASASVPTQKSPAHVHTPSSVTVKTPAPKPPAPPAAPQKPAPLPPQGIVNAQTEKEMSMFHLLMHYSKENKEIYNAQKANKSQNVQVKPPKQKKNKMLPHETPFSVPDANVPPGYQTPQPAPVPQPMPVQNQQSAPAAPPISSVPSAPAANASYPMATSAADFGETTLLGGASDETTILSVDPSIEPVSNVYLVRVRTNERIPIDCDLFRIGKEKEYVEYHIENNAAISRSHASIKKIGEDYFIVDTNSTNHTYLDGLMIKSNMETKLAHGAKIRLANEEFIFYTY